MTIVSFSGHRPEKCGGYKTPNPIYTYICQHIENTIKELRPEKAISGMALGADTWAAEICIKLSIPFIAAIPFKGQELYWPEFSRKKYFDLLDHAESIKYISPGGFTNWKFQARNQWMVDNSDTLIAIFNQSHGGTYNCVKYAEEQKKNIITIDPRKSPNY